MESRNTDESVNLLKNPGKSSVRTDQPERKVSNSSNGLTTSANNTNPIVCAVCGSKEYITLHTHDKGNYLFGLTSGWNSPELLKKNLLTSEFTQAYGPLSPLGQAFFPHLSLFNLPSNFYYSHYNSHFRIPSTSCVPLEKYFGDSHTEIDASKAATINSESTIYREPRETKKKNKYTRMKADYFRKDGSNSYKNAKDESRPTSAFTNVSEMRNFPLALHQPWLGNICPIFPYTYAPLALPVNHPLIPVYLPVPGKWQSDEVRNEEGTIGSSASNSPIGDSNSVTNEGGEKSEQKGENNSSEYDFEVFARELVGDQKSNYDDEEEEVDINLDEITSSLKLPDIGSGREINSDKFFNSKEKWNTSGKDDPTEKDGIRNWRLSSEINMQDCCIRTLSNENLWYEDQDGDKKTWNSLQEYYSKDSGFTGDTKCNVKEVDRPVVVQESIGDGEAKTVWSSDRSRTPDELESKIQTNSKKTNEKNLREHKVTFGDLSQFTSTSKDKRNEWSKTSTTELSNDVEMRLAEDKLNSLPDSVRLRDLRVMGDEARKLDLSYSSTFTEDAESSTKTEKFRKSESKTSGLMQHLSLNTNISKIRRDEKVTKSFGLMSSKYESLKIPVLSPRKNKRQEETKKRWVT